MKRWLLNIVLLVAAPAMRAVADDRGLRATRALRLFVMLHRTIAQTRVAIVFLFLDPGGLVAPAAVDVCAATPGEIANEVTDLNLLKQPQWTTSSRLLKLGEQIQFRLYVPANVEPGTLEIFPRFLETTDANVEFDPYDGNKPWLKALKSESLALELRDGMVLVTYKPQAAGSYLARWQVNGETLFRYFAAVEDDWVAVRFSTYYALTPHPALHGVGLPLDYRPPAIASMAYERQYESADENVDKVLFEANRKHGDSIIPSLPSTFGKTDDERLAIYGPMIDKVRKTYPDSSSARSARIQWKFEDTGAHRYQPVLQALGVNDNCGMWVGNATPWRGMPEFPFFTSAEDDRAADQTGKSQVIAHQWDFTASWHFLGPVSWHLQASRGDFALSRDCLTDGLKEYENLAALSGHPAFVVGPLYDGTEYFSYPRNREAHTWVDIQNRERFVKDYLRFFAFEAPKNHKLVFARSIDVADYYLRHFAKTPRTIFSCKTDHVHYDMWWLPSWAGESQVSFIQEFLPWFTRFSGLLKLHEIAASEYYRDPLSYEYLQIEDHRSSLRFERNSPNPIWMFRYAPLKHEQNGYLARSLYPDVFVEDVYKRRLSEEQGITDPLIVTSIDSMPFWRRSKDGPWIRLKCDVQVTSEMRARGVSEDFDDYAICLWNIPEEFARDPNRDRIKTNATDFIVAKNTDGEYHLVLLFDLKPDLVIDARIVNSTSTAGDRASAQ